MKLSVLGAGSFGTAIANHAAGGGHEVMMWCRKPERAEAINRERENNAYLPGIALEPTLRANCDLEDCMAFSGKVILAIPTQWQRNVLEQIAKLGASCRGIHILNLAKGMEIGTGHMLHQIAGEILPEASYSVLSGPSHAEEVSRGMPTALVAASEEEHRAAAWQDLLNDNRLRVYTSNDVLGVEIGGAMKNVIAIAVGIARALGFGDNSVAALVTRGLAEIMRYGAHAGANRMTLAGLTGIGDLMVTCYSMHSRNLRFGLAIGKGAAVEDAAAKIGQVVEGMHTARALVTRARLDDIDLPLSDGVYRLIYEGEPLVEVMRELMFREPKSENE